MASLDEYLIGAEATVAVALETINRSEGKIALVVDSDRRLELSHRRGRRSGYRRLGPS